MHKCMQNCLPPVRTAVSVWAMKKLLGNANGIVARKANACAPARSKARAGFPPAVKPAGVMRDAGVNQFCMAYALPRDVFTRLAGFSPRAVANWVQGKRPSASTQRRLTELSRLFETLEKLVASEAIGSWLNESNPAFDGSTPLQVIERGETDRLWRMIYELQSGEPG